MFLAKRILPQSLMFTSWRVLGKITSHERPFSKYSDDPRELLRVSGLIKQHTNVVKKFLTPEIALHLITPSCPLWTSPLEDVPFVDPYWAFYWPGGQAIARYILDHPGIVHDRRVFDLGSGCGACAIAASMSNAWQVIANDIDSVACSAILLNSALNNVTITVSTQQVIGNAVDVGDCILVGDMFYDEEFADLLIRWLQRIRKEGKHVLVGDPGRLTFMKYKDYFELLATYSLGSEDFSHGFLEVSVWKMK